MKFFGLLAVSVSAAPCMFQNYKYGLQHFLEALSFVSGFTFIKKHVLLNNKNSMYMLLYRRRTGNNSVPVSSSKLILFDIFY